MRASIPCRCLHAATSPTSATPPLRFRIAISSSPPRTVHLVRSSLLAHLPRVFSSSLRMGHSYDSARSQQRRSSMTPFPRMDFRSLARPQMRSNNRHAALACATSTRPAASASNTPRAFLATSPVVDTFGKDLNEKEKSKVYAGLDVLTTEEQASLEPLAQLFAKDKWAEAVDMCRKFMVTKESKFRPLLFVQLGDALSPLGDVAEAVKAYQTAIDLESTYGEAHYRLGFLYFNAAESSTEPSHKIDLGKSAKSCLTTASALLADDPSVPHTLGQLELNILRNPAEALVCGKEALKRDSHWAPAMLLMANAYMKREEWPAAIDSLNKFYDKFPTFFRAQRARPPFVQVMSETVVKRGIAYLRMGEYGMAEMDFNAVLNIAEAPQQHKMHAYNGRGGVRLAKKDFWGAVEDHTEAAKLAPRLAESYKLRAIAYDSVGKKVEAEKDREMFEFLARELSLEAAKR